MNVFKNKVRKTSRGFDIIDFKDYYDEECSIQQSSMVGDNKDSLTKPGTFLVWLGAGKNRMHLNRKQVTGLIKVMKHWLKTGTL